MPDVSDISGHPVPEGTGGIARIFYADTSKEPLEFQLTDSEVEQLKTWTEKTTSSFALKRGRRSGVSGRVIRPARGASLDLNYQDGDQERHLNVNLTDHEVNVLTGHALKARFTYALALAGAATGIAIALALLINSGVVTSHPVWVLSIVTAVTVTVATLFWQALERVSSRAVIIASGLGVLLTTLFAIAPNLAPETSNNFEMSALTVERGVSLREYLNEPHAKASLGCGEKCDVKTLVENYCAAVRETLSASKVGETTCPPPPRQAVVVYVPMESSGFRGKKLPISWRLFDHATGSRVVPHPVALFEVQTVEPERREKDIVTFPLWIDTSRTSAKRLFVRVYVSDPRGFVLATAKSPTFLNPAKLR